MSVHPSIKYVTVPLCWKTLCLGQPLYIQIKLHQYIGWSGPRWLPMQRCTIPLDRSPWQVNDPLGREKWPKHSTDLASKFFSSAHLFSSENEIFSLSLQTTIRFRVYSSNFRCIWNVSDVKVTAAIYFYPHWVSQIRTRLQVHVFSRHMSKCRKCFKM
jgi:hypothetical protein